MNDTKLFSSVVTSLRFPLIILVILIHSAPIAHDTLNGAYGIYGYVAILIQEEITRVAVPAFFAFAGYYAFLGKDLEKMSVYLSELKKKAWTLITPYFLWNILYLLILVAKEPLATLLGRPAYDPLDFSWAKLPSYLWFDCIDYPLWFVRDLISITLITPLIHFLLRWTRGYILIPYIILCTFVGDPLGIPGLESRSLLFYAMGALFAMKGWDPEAKLKPLRIPSVIIWVIGSVTLPLFYYASYYRSLELPYLIFSIVMWILLFAWLVEHRPKLTAWLQQLNKYVFFIYAAHAVLLINWARGIVSRIPFLTQGDLGLILAYFAIAGITLAMTLALYWVMRRVAPRVLSILCGGRIA